MPWTTPIRAFATCRSPASPRSWRTASTSNRRPSMPGMVVGQPAARRHRGQGPAGREPAVLDERAALAAGAESQVLQVHDDGAREVVVGLDEVDVPVRHPRPGEGVSRRHGARGHREVPHLRDVPVGVALPGPQDADRAAWPRPCARPPPVITTAAAAVGHQAAVQAAQRIADHLRGQDLVDRQRLPDPGLGVPLRPLARRHRDLGQLLRPRPELCMWRAAIRAYWPIGDRIP